MSDEPTNVLDALRAVSEDVGYISKSRKAGKEGGPKYDYRGIEDVLEACQPLFIKYKIVVAPQVQHAESVLRTISNTDGTVRRQEYEAQVLINYRVFGPGGPEDFIDCPIFATGLSPTALASGSAYSYAYKSLMFQLLCIPTAAAEDNEAHEPERTPAPQPVAKDAEWEAIAADLRAHPERKRIVDELVGMGLFRADPAKGNLPNTPFTAEQKGMIRGMLNPISKAAPSTATAEDVMAAHEATFGSHEHVPSPVDAAALLAAEPAHAEHAVATVLQAIGATILPVDITTAQWYLADYADPDEIDWKQAAKAFQLSQSRLLTMARGICQEDPDVFGTAPERLDEIHGDLAVQLRLNLIARLTGDPFP